MGEPEISCGSKIPKETQVQSSNEAVIFKQEERNISSENKGGKSTSDTELICGENEST